MLTFNVILGYQGLLFGDFYWCFFFEIFFPIQLTDPISGNAFEAKRKKFICAIENLYFDNCTIEINKLLLNSFINYYFIIDWKWLSIQGACAAWFFSVLQHLPLYFNVLNFCLIVCFSFQVYLYNSFNGFFVVLMFLVLTFFLIYGVELFYKVLKIRFIMVCFVCFFLLLLFS